MVSCKKKHITNKKAQFEFFVFGWWDLPVCAVACEAYIYEKYNKKLVMLVRRHCMGWSLGVFGWEVGSVLLVNLRKA